MDIKHRSFEFSVDIVRFCLSLQGQTHTPAVLGEALLRAGTAIAAHVEEAHGSSRADFIAGMQAAGKSAREAHYWLRLLDATELAVQAEITPLLDEAQQLAAILSSIVKTAKQQ